MNMEKSQRGKRIALRIVSVLLAIVLVMMLGATVLADTILNNLNYVEKGQSESLSYEEALALKEQAQAATEEDEDDANLETLNEDDVNLDIEILGGIGLEKHIINVLLIGQDSRTGARERSDTMLLITFNTEKNSITITSFMRDIYVKIPGYYKEKLNAAYMLGGMDLLNETLYQNFGIVVDHNVEVSFGQFTDIIDYLGGIDLELDAKEAAFVNKAMGAGAAQLEAGMNHLNGHRALAYARYRDKATGDFGRTERQRKTLNALIEEYKHAKLTTMVGMVNALTGMVTTNMTKSEILNYAVEFFPMLSSAEIISQRVPFDGEHTDGKDYYSLAMIDGISVVVPHLDGIVEKLNETLS